VNQPGAPPSAILIPISCVLHRPNGSSKSRIRAILERKPPNTPVRREAPNRANRILTGIHVLLANETFHRDVRHWAIRPSPARHDSHERMARISGDFCWPRCPFPNCSSDQRHATVAQVNRRRTRSLEIASRHTTTSRAGRDTFSGWRGEPCGSGASSARPGRSPGERAGHVLKRKQPVPAS
jgi:hypothetical protein